MFHFKGKRMTNITRKFASVAGILFMAMALGCASTAKQEGTGEYVDDTVVTSKVKAAIFNEPTLKSAEINVETFKGVVQLSGFVTSQAAESKAIEVTRTVPGVKSVKNDMRLK
jgi:osmotically-inducible protein OsmY